MSQLSPTYFVTKIDVAISDFQNFISNFHFRPCDHRCVNLGGYYRCLCEEGFELEKDERSCKRVKSKCDLKESEMNLNLFPISNLEGLNLNPDFEFRDSDSRIFESKILKINHETPFISDTVST